ncbi:putative aryl-alcohol dehydrogenase, partial [Mucor mucedo]|uniref:putative aryl-alcohol dehydrogenase n=1 Tax=Mucor mucedo TaxID=29922 RepID=UPI00221EE3F4
YIWASCMPAWKFHKLNAIAERKGWAKFVPMNHLYNSLYREEEREIKPYCLDVGISGMPHSHFGGGKLTGKSRTTTRSDAIFVTTRIYPEANQDCNETIIDRVQVVAKILMPQVLRLLWRGILQSLILSPVVGVSKIKQLYDLIGAMDIKLTKKEIGYSE